MAPTYGEPVEIKKQFSILVFAASNSTTSINQRLALHAARVLKDELAAEVEIDLLDLNDYEMPIFSPEREREGGVPQLAQDFYGRIGAADGLIISYAEYNGLYTAAFKNLFDWCSRIDMKVFQNKPTVALSASPGKGGGASVLKTALESAGFFGADIKGSMSVGPFAQQFDLDSNQLSNPDLAARLREALMALKAALV